RSCRDAAADGPHEAGRSCRVGKRNIASRRSQGIEGLRRDDIPGRRKPDARERCRARDARAAGAFRVIKPPQKPRGRIKPGTLMGEAAAPRVAAPPAEARDAFRRFMIARRLRASQWAKDAGVPPGEIFSFLTGRSRGISVESAERLAKAAKVRPEDMF